MISEKDRKTIIAIASRYGVKSILLFGSGTDPACEAEDIDLAVEGIRPADFFKFYGELIFSLSKPVDLIELSDDNKFNRIVRRDGVPLYD